MNKFSYANLPRMKILSEESIEKIVDVSFQLLERIGVEVKFKGALELLRSAGCEIDEKRSRVKIPPDLARKAVKSAPSSIKLHSRDGKHNVTLEGDNVFFRTGSAAISILDSETMEIRDLLLRDSRDLTIVTDYLNNIQIPSGQVPRDVPELIIDRFRLYVPIKYSVKPVFAASLTFDGIHDMKKILDIVAGNTAKKPMAILGFCPSPPLKWSDYLVSNLIDCAKYNIPIELISMPQLTATGPATLTGCVVQHAAETLSGIVISQLARKGAPVIYGGALMGLDMRYATATVGPEILLMVLATVEVGKYFGLPTHTYLGESDAKTIDGQMGFQSGIGILMGVLGKVNLIAGPGMLALGMAQSPEKLVIDNEICGYAYRVAKGLTVSDETIPSIELFEEAVDKGEFLSLKHTLEWFRKEIHFPSKIIDTMPLERVRKEGKVNIFERAREEVKRILKVHEPEPLPHDIGKELDQFITAIAKEHGMNKVPV